MKLGKTNKNYKLLIYSLFVFILSGFLVEVSVADTKQIINQAVIHGLKQGQPDLKLNEGLKTVPPATDDVVVVITEDKEPLKIPEAFLKALKEKGITGITLGNGSGEVRLLSINGDYINPCAPKSKTSTTGEKAVSAESTLPCRYQGGLGETHTLIASRSNMLVSACGACIGGGIARNCSKAYNKWSCSTKATKCDTGSYCQ